MIATRIWNGCTVFHLLSGTTKYLPDGATSCPWGQHRQGGAAVNSPLDPSATIPLASADDRAAGPFGSGGSSLNSEQELDGLADGVEDAADLTAKEDQGHDGHDRDEGEDK